MKTTILAAFLTLTTVVGFSGWWFWRDMQAQLHAPLSLAAAVDFTITPGMSLKSVCRELQKTELLPKAHYLWIAARLQGRERQIKAGEYLIAPGTTPAQLLDQFIAGKVKHYALTLIEGWTLNRVLDEIKHNGQLVHSLDTSEHFRILAMVGLEDKASAEGLFFPDTYHFTRGTTDVEFLRRASRRMQKILAEEWQQREAGLPYNTPYEALIMASLIEKETAVPEERPLIAGVFVRRLQKGMPLQTDPTVIYALGEDFDGNLRKEDMAIASPYNTYVHAGLPPTPIAIPGREAVHAALHPEEGTALYFVAMGNGAHHFSETYSEHMKAVARYQKGSGGE